MIQALRQAEVLDFALGLTDKLETYVGSGGNQLSGGQKQRIAIARTLLKNPFIFFLD
jgi:ABC-type multidrug transport system fused ATPase/permease subunit